MKLEIGKCYRVKKPYVYNIISTVIKHQRKMFDPATLCALTCANKEFSVVVPEIMRLIDIDFSLLREPMLDYKSRTEVDLDRVDMVGAAMIHFGLNPGRVVRCIGGEYTVEQRGVPAILAVVQSYISDEDYDHMERILTGMGV